MNKNTITFIFIALLMGFVFVISNMNTANQARFADQFQEWKRSFGSQFSPIEEIYRKIIFAKNIETIIQHNNDQTQSYKIGVNQFTIYSKQQFIQLFLSDSNIKQRENQELKYKEIELTVNKKRLNYKAGDIDWTTVQGVVGPVRAQGSCRASWAFAPLGVVQSAYKITYNKTVTLSPQQLIDCAGDQGCNGGFSDQAIGYLNIKGVVTQTQYPFVQKQQVCKQNGGNYKIKFFQKAPSCTGLQNLLTVSPVVVSVDASNMGSYKSGIFNSCSDSINHNVILVGLINSNWKIKNNWGTAWGQNGYMRIASGNTCGICIRQGLLFHV